MRRMRENSSVLFLLSFPVLVGASIGIFRWMENKRGQSVARQSVDPAGKEGGNRKVASTVTRPKKDHGSVESGGSEDSARRLSAQQAREIERSLVAYGPTDDAKTCGSFEYFGRGQSHPSPSQADWRNIMNTFHGVKADLAKWLGSRHWNLSQDATQALEARIRELRIQRPPTLEEPDLTWRGIGVLTRDTEGRPLVRLGAGFPKLLKTRPARARFELARLMAQVWAPCELAAAQIQDPWNPLLQCLKMEGATGCGAGQYSEAGWAVSSVIARQVASPGCELPAFQGEANTALKGCADQIPFPMNARAPAESQAVAARGGSSL